MAIPVHTWIPFPVERIREIESFVRHQRLSRPGLANATLDLLKRFQLLEYGRHLDRILEEARLLRSAGPMAQFTEYFARGLVVLGFDDLQASVVFDCSQPNLLRWKTGATIPPAAHLILQLMKQEVEDTLLCLERA